MKMVGALIPPLPQAPEDEDVSGWLATHDSVIFVGLGTTTRLTSEQVRDMLTVARRLGKDHHILWKLPSEQQRLLPDGPLPENVRIESWVLPS